MKKNTKLKFSYNSLNHMNVGIVTTWFERGAAYVSRQYQEALQREHHVFIYARGGEGYAIGDPSWDGPNVTWGKKIPIHMPMSIDLFDFQDWIVNNKLDVVFFNEQQWWNPVILCNKLGIKTGAYVDYYTKETVPFFKLYDFLICNTRRHRSVFSWHTQAEYIPWGTDIDLFKPQKLDPVDLGKVTFFHSCGVSPERKGTDLLLKSFVKVQGPTKLIIHSQVDLNIFYPHLKQIISDLENFGRLIIKKETVSAPGLYYLGDVYVYPTRLEGIGLTMAEAGASGLPLIVPDNGPMNEFVDGTNGKTVKIEKYFERGDGYFWSQCEVQLLSLTEVMQFYVDNLDELESLKKMARVYAENHFDWKKNSANVSKLFAQFKIISLKEKEQILKEVINYEEKRSNWQTKLYRSCPWLFKPFSWFWPLIKIFYK